MSNTNSQATIQSCRLTVGESTNSATDLVDQQSGNQGNPNESTATKTLENSPSNSIGRPNSNQEQLQSPVSTNRPIRIPGTYPPEWLPDHDTDSCMSCDSLFTLIKRRHHCRSCGKIFCADCCRQKAKLLYLDNKEARVCNSCFDLIEATLSNSSVDTSLQSEQQQQQNSSPSSSQQEQQQTRPNSGPKVQGVLKTSNQSRTATIECNTSLSSASDQQNNKQVIFSDGIRPGTDLSESFPYPIPSSSTSAPTPSSSFSLLTRQNKGSDIKGGKKNKDFSHKNITVCDELGYLPPIVISMNSAIANLSNDSSATNSHEGNKSIQASMESRSCALNGVIKFEDISGLVGVDDVVTFMLLKDFYLKVKLVEKGCCIDKNLSNQTISDEQESLGQILETDSNGLPKYWCFCSDGLVRYGQNEVVLVIDKDRSDPCIPRDIFMIFLMLHELALRRQTLENLGNLLFQDGMFYNRDTAGLLFVRPLDSHCLKNLVLPNKPFLIALVFQRCEVPWSKVFPMRLLLRLGHKFGVYPYPIVSFKAREPVYYEVGHTIISILCDLRNFRYSLTHVDGLKVMLDKSTRKVLIKLKQSCYQQFNKVLDSSNNEHVLAWSSCTFPEANGHLVSVQNEDGQYETVEFFKKAPKPDISFETLEKGAILGASFVIFSGALKVNQTGQSAKISIVEDGLLIQIQSCTMTALRNAIHFMHHFDIDCESTQDTLNRVEIDWQLEDT